MQEDIPVQCPCCKAWFYFPSGHPVHTRDQLELKLEALRESHPEVSDDEGGDPV